MKSLFSRNKGIGLIEILITMGVLAVGILGVAALNSVTSRQSQENKAQAEALAIAQSRIEELRNYTNDAASLAAFDALFPSSVNFINAAYPEGVNAAYTRQEKVTDSGDDKLLQVVVTWTNAAGDTQTASLDSTLSYLSPRSIGDGAHIAAEETVNAPTGKATLGAGTIDIDEASDDTANGDTTVTYRVGNDLKLVDGDQDGDEIVLTLANACQTDAGCIDFVKIKGTVWLNTSKNGNKPDLKDLFLIASDAAYCARYYLDDNGEPVKITNDTTTVPTTSDYQHYDYTCYLGGGWHGNIGLLYGNGSNPSSDYRACLGDPTPAALLSEKPIVSARRAYRGALYKIDANADNGRQQLNNMDRFYSQGIKDSAVLTGHDFVVGYVGSDNNSSLCETSFLMEGSGSNENGIVGDRFENTPTDFVCLNGSGNLDISYDHAIFGADDHCDFDATSPPSSKHTISGTISVTGADTPDNDAIVAGMIMVTSDGPANCAFDSDFSNSGGVYSAPYTCAVFDWGDGWNGSFGPTYNLSAMQCNPCILSPTPSPLTSITGQNFTSCAIGRPAVIYGTVSQVGGNGAGATNRNLVLPITISSGSCQLVDPLHFICTTPLLESNTTWAGTITLKAASNNNGGNAGKICKETNTTPVNTNANSLTYSYTGVPAGIMNVTIKIGNTAADGCPP